LSAPALREVVVTTDRQVLERIWARVAEIPRGTVASYGRIAAAAGVPGRARLVGRALKLAPEELGLPWHRVVGSGGRLCLPPGSPADAEQRRRLEAEDVCMRGRRVDLAREGGARALDRALWGPTLPRRGPRGRR
jgi:methylated-DNA-protein-cysteine methyltransferase related protein